MKRIFATALAVLAAFSLAGCGGGVAELTPSPSPLVTPVLTPANVLEIPLEEYPRVDGSTANLPLMAAVMAELTGVSTDEAEMMTSCTTTPYSYEALVSGEADLLLAYEPAEETYELIAASGVELEFIPIGRDALVFIANKANPVTGLTSDQLRDIYTGNITSWREVGGNANSIKAYQRASASGSQALFIKLLMGDTAPMEAPTEFYPSGMGELIEVLATYDNDGGALGFSVYYYASSMYSKPDLKFLKVDGVAPNDETIADGTYPFLNPFYAVIRKDAPIDSPERKIAEWLTTAAGKKCMTDAGYIAFTTEETP